MEQKEMMLQDGKRLGKIERVLVRRFRIFFGLCSPEVSLSRWWFKGPPSMYGIAFAQFSYLLQEGDPSFAVNTE